MTPAPLRHLLFALVWGMASLHAEEPYTIAVLISSQKGSISDTVESIRHFTEKQVREWNRQEQGLSGRKVKLLFLDDYEQGDQTKLNVREALEDENLIGFLGLWSSSRGAGVTEMIGQSGVPFISEMSLDSLFADYPTIYTLTTSVSDDTRCFQRFLRDHFADTLFVGVTGDLFTQAFHTALTELSDDVALSSEHWIKPQDDIPPGKLQSIISDIRKQQPQVLTLGVGSYRGGIVLKALAEANIKVPVFFATGSIPRVLRNMEGVNYEGPLYELGRSIPHVENERLAAQRRGGKVTEKEAQWSNDDLASGLPYRDMLAMML
ncbi:MAG: ABC transporter substrate-binding protein, partial [Verrucomicrobiota bacterium]